MAEKLELLAIVGPTASGKTGASIELAKKLNGEIISADSRAVYKGLDIGTATPTMVERQGVIHYGFNLINPDRRYSVSDFKEYATQKTAEIIKKGKLPIIVGGTGLYVDAFLYNFQLPKPNYSLRIELENKTISQLQQQIMQLKLVMPVNNKNKLHLVSTIERGKTVPTKSHNLPRGWKIIGINPGKDQLSSRISTRASQMFKAGVAIEAQKASTQYGWESPGLNGGVYKVLRKYFENELSMEECLEKFIQSDKNLAKRQITWFRRNKDILWAKNLSNILEIVD